LPFDLPLPPTDLSLTTSVLSTTSSATSDLSLQGPTLRAALWPWATNSQCWATNSQCRATKKASIPNHFFQWGHPKFFSGHHLKILSVGPWSYHCKMASMSTKTFASAQGRASESSTNTPFWASSDNNNNNSEFL